VDNRSEGAEIYIDTAEGTPKPAPKPAHTEPCTKPTFDVHIAATARSGAGHQAGNNEEGRRIQTKRKKRRKNQRSQDLNRNYKTYDINKHIETCCIAKEAKCCQKEHTRTKTTDPDPSSNGGRLSVVARPKKQKSYNCTVEGDRSCRRGRVVQTQERGDLRRHRKVFTETYTNTYIAEGDASC
jgi:hypothetical protein